MTTVAIRVPTLLTRVGMPMLSSSCVFGCTLLAGDLLSQVVSRQDTPMYGC